MITKRDGVMHNALMAIAQVVVTGAGLFFLYRYLLEVLGAESVGIWAIVLTTTSTVRVSELGLAGGAIKFVAAANAKSDFSKAADVVQTALLTIGVILSTILITAYPLITRLFALIVPADNLVATLKLVPYAAASVLVSSIGGVVLASLDGCQRADLRAMVAMVATVFYLILAFLLTPIYGLIGLGIAQVFQSVFILIVSWVLLHRFLPNLPIIPLRWRFNIFSEMFSYGINFQVISIVSMLYEPLTKVFLTKFGGLTATAYFEMANRMVLQFRGLIVAANQVLVPKIAAIYERETPAQIHRLYQDTYRLSLYLTLPLFMLLVSSIPFISFVWIGHEDQSFVFFGVIVALGYLINTLSAPAYFMNLGIGELKWNVISHVALGLLTLLLGYSMGILFGGRGAVAGAIASLVVASVITIWATHRDHNLPFNSLIPKESRWLIFSCIFSTMSGVGIPNFLSEGFTDIFRYSTGLLIAILILIPAIWLHPVRSVILYKIFSWKKREPLQN